MIIKEIQAYMLKEGYRDGNCAGSFNDILSAIVEGDARQVFSLIDEAVNLSKQDRDYIGDQYLKYLLVLQDEIKVDGLGSLQKEVALLREEQMASVRALMHKVAVDLESYRLDTKKTYENAQKQAMQQRQDESNELSAAIKGALLNSAKAKLFGSATGKNIPLMSAKMKIASELHSNLLELIQESKNESSVTASGLAWAMALHLIDARKFHHDALKAHAPASNGRLGGILDDLHDYLKSSYPLELRAAVQHYKDEALRPRPMKK